MTNRLEFGWKGAVPNVGVPPRIQRSQLIAAFASTSVAVAGEPVETVAQVNLPRTPWELFSLTKVRSLALLEPDPATIVDRAIKEAKWILELEDGWDEDEAPAYKEADLRRAHRILLALLKEASAWGIPADIDPDINPAISGGIDLCWDSEDASMAVNVSTDPDGPVTFYREREGGLAGKGWILER